MTCKEGYPKNTAYVSKLYKTLKAAAFATAFFYISRILYMNKNPYLV